MKRYYIISVAIHITIMFLFVSQTENKIKNNYFNQSKYSIEVFFNNAINKARQLAKNRKISAPVSYVKAGIEEFAKVIRYNEPPRYPALALRHNWTGTVILSFFINRNGRLDNIKIKRSSGYKVLDEAAVASAYNWQFKEGDKNLMVDYPVSFTIE